MKGLFFNKHDLYKDKIEKIIELSKGTDLRLDCLKMEYGARDAFDFFKRNKYDFLIHRNEHGSLFKGKDLKTIVEFCGRNYVPFLNFDFGYFDHYKSIMVDFYLPDMSSSIKEEWDSISRIVNWNYCPKYIRKYREKVKTNCQLFGGESICELDMSKCVVIWMQWNTDLLRNSLYIDGRKITQSEWINLIAKKIKSLGLTPVVKMGMVNHSEIYNDTVPLIDKSIMLISDREAVKNTSPRAIFEKNANHILIENAKYHILLCSSVSNEIVLMDKPVIATGKSWFNDLDVFYEPKTWDESFDEPKINQKSRNKWINWWLSRQVEIKDSPQKIIDVFNLAKGYFYNVGASDYQI